jgi:hypothetical protein
MVTMKHAIELDSDNQQILLAIENWRVREHKKEKLKNEAKPSLVHVIESLAKYVKKKEAREKGAAKAKEEKKKEREMWTVRDAAVVGKVEEKEGAKVASPEPAVGEGLESEPQPGRADPNKDGPTEESNQMPPDAVPRRSESPATTSFFDEDQTLATMEDPNKGLWWDPKIPQPRRPYGLHIKNVVVAQLAGKVARKKVSRNYGKRQKSSRIEFLV